MREGGQGCSWGEEETKPQTPPHLLILCSLAWSPGMTGNVVAVELRGPRLFVEVTTGEIWVY